MPLATRPNATYEIVLSTDKHLPEDKRPVFIFRFISTIEWEQIADLSDEFDAATDTKQMTKLAFKVIEKVLCGWRNMTPPDGKEIPFNLKKLRGMITLQEAIELMQAAVSQRPSSEDKKKFDSPSDSSTAESAKPAKE